MGILNDVVNFLKGGNKMDKAQIETALAEAIKAGDQTSIDKYEAELFALKDPAPVADVVAVVESRDKSLSEGGSDASLR